MVNRAIVSFVLVVLASAPVAAFFGSILCPIGIGCDEEVELTSYYYATLDPSQNTHSTCDRTTARGNAVVTLLNNNLCFRVSYTGFENRVESVANIRGPALLGANGVIVFGLPLGPVKRTCLPIYGEQLDFLKEGLLYINITSTTEGCEIGDIRGQILPLAAAPAS